MKPNIKLLLFVLFSYFSWGFSFLSKAEETYVISNVEVDVRASSALEARTQALILGHLRAFHLLLEEILTEDKRKLFESVSVKDIEFLVQDLEITQERLSSMRYMATLLFRFNPQAVRAFLARKVPEDVLLSEGISQNFSALVLPVFIQDGHALLWDDSNPWFETWSQGYESSDLKLHIPLGDLKDVSTLTAQETLTGEISKMKTLMDHYRVTSVFAIILRQNKELEPSSLELIHYDQNGVVNQDKQELPSENASSFFQQALKKALEMMHAFRASLKEASEVHTLTLEVSFATYKEWQELRELLLKISFLQKLSITSLSRQKALLTITYQGSQKKLQEALKSRNITFEETKSGSWRLIHLWGKEILREDLAREKRERRSF